MVEIVGSTHKKSEILSKDCFIYKLLIKINIHYTIITCHI